MLCRVLGALILAAPLFGAASGCDNRPKIVLPTTQAPPPPRPAVLGGGPAAPPAPVAEPDKEGVDSNKPPADQTPPNDKQ
jgi:hypothetical protein